MRQASPWTVNPMRADYTPWSEWALEEPSGRQWILDAVITKVSPWPIRENWFFPPKILKHQDVLVHKIEQLCLRALATIFTIKLWSRWYEELCFKSNSFNISKTIYVYSLLSNASGLTLSIRALSIIYILLDSYTHLGRQLFPLSWTSFFFSLISL